MNTVFNNINNKFMKTIKPFNKLPMLQKLFILMLILLFIVVVFDKTKHLLLVKENFKENNEDYNKANNFVMKHDNKVFDEFYTNYYDHIHLNKKKNNFEIGKIMGIEKPNNHTKILDVGCGTGHHVDLLSKKNLEVIGLDQSPAMIAKATENYPNCEFVKGNILNNTLFDYGTFTHILCLGQTIYYIKKKAEFFENCYSLLADGGYLVIHLVKRDEFKPFVSPDDATVIYDPEKYKKKDVTQTIIKFGKDDEYVSNYVLNKDANEDADVNAPYAVYKEKFQNYATNNIRKNEINLYMPALSQVLNIAKSKGFSVHKKIDMDPVKHNNQYLYVLQK